MIRICNFIAFCLFIAVPELRAHSTTLGAVIINEGSFVQDRNRDQVELNIKLSEQVPFRIYFLDKPKTLVIEFVAEELQNVDLKKFTMSDSVADVKSRLGDEGWFSLSLELVKPLGLKSAEMRGDGSTGIVNLSIWLEPITRKEFLYLSNLHANAENARFSRFTKIAKEAKYDGQVRIVIDHGHGGLDPGAMAGKFKESELMLTFAFELKEALMRIDEFDVFLTRYEDRFLSLNDRVLIAQQKEADLFISLHADAITKGIARGTTIYTLSKKGLAPENERSYLKMGTDLAGVDDEIASILFELATVDTLPRSEALARVAIEELFLALGSINAKPLRQGDFSVLKTPNIPSILIEVGFMSTQSDLQNLTSPIWRRKFINGLRSAIQRWISEDKLDAIRRRH